MTIGMQLVLIGFLCYYIWSGDKYRKENGIDD